MSLDADAFKRAAGERAASYIQKGMVVGLGTGSTAIFATRKLGELLSSGALRDVTAIPTSRVTEAEARRLGIPLIDESIPSEIDLTIDGADEVDPALNLIKGGGGALFREKIVAEASRRVVIVVDESKLSPALGTRHELPVEVATDAEVAQIVELIYAELVEKLTRSFSSGGDGV